MGTGCAAVIKRIYNMDPKERMNYINWYFKYTPKNLNELVSKSGTIEKRKEVH